MPVILYWGEEDFNIENSVLDLKSRVLDPNWAMLNHKVLNQPDLKTLIETVETTPMMFGNLLIEVNAENLFLRGNGAKIDSNDSNLVKLLNIIESINDNIYLLFVCKVPRNSGKKIDSTKKLTKTIKKFGKIEEFAAFKSYQEDKAAFWAVKHAKNKKMQLSSDIAMLLVQQVGVDLRKLNIELNKLQSYIYPEKTVKKEDIKQLCCDHENIFLMTDFWLTGQKDKAIIELRKLFEKNHPVRIIATMQSLLKRWLRIKVESAGMAPKEIAQIVGLHPFVVEQDLKKLKNISVESLIERRKLLNDSEYKLKSGKIAPELALEMVVAS